MVSKLWKSEPIAILGAVQAIVVVGLTLVHMDPALKASVEAAVAAILATIGRGQVTPVVSPPAVDPEVASQPTAS